MWQNIELDHVMDMIKNRSTTKIFKLCLTWIIGVSCSMMNFWPSLRYFVLFVYWLILLALKFEWTKWWSTILVSNLKVYVRIFIVLGQLCSLVCGLNVLVYWFCSKYRSVSQMTNQMCCSNQLNVGFLWFLFATNFWLSLNMELSLGCLSLALGRKTKFN